MEDDNSMSERILQRIEYILRTDPDLKDFTIIPTTENARNKSPVLYVDHSIGLESWCVKYVYRQVCADLFEVRDKLSKSKLSCDKMEKLHHLLIGALLINSEVPTFWAMKKELIQSDIISTEQEIFFTKIVLSHKSKSNETFSHRRWLLKRTLAKSIPNDSLRLYNLLQREFEVSEMAANASPNNYHSWNHRIWCMENIAKLVNGTDYNLNYIVDQELDFSSKWLQQHVSEHTGYHYRQYLINLLFTTMSITTINSIYVDHVNTILKVYKDPISLLSFLLGKINKPLNELNRIINFVALLLYDLTVLVNNLNMYFVGHESLWYHRRWLFYSLMKVVHDYHNIPFTLGKNINNKYHDVGNNNIVDNILFSHNIEYENSSENGEKLPKLIKFMPNKRQSETKLYSLAMQIETDFLRHNKDNHNSNSNDSLIQLELVKRHEQWLRLFLGFN